MTIKTEAQRRISDALAQADRAEAAAINYGEGTTLGLEAYASAKTIRTQADRIASLEAELKKKNDLLVFVERWAVHHGTKPHMTAKEALGLIQHHPGIRAITASYVDGKHPDTFDPYAEIEQLKAQLSQAQAVQIEGLHNACTYALEWLNECGGNLAHNVVDVLEQALAASPTPPARKGLSKEAIADIAEQVEALDPNDSIWVELTRLIEAAHGIQGEGNGN